MPLCFGAFGSVRASSAPQLRELRESGPDLLAGDSPAAVDLDGLGWTGRPGPNRRRARNTAGTRSFAAQCRRQKALLLVFIAERDDRWDEKAGDCPALGAGPGGAEFLRGDDLLDRGGRAAPRRAADTASPSHPQRSLLCADRTESPWSAFDFRADLLTQLLGLRVEGRY